MGGNLGHWEGPTKVTLDTTAPPRAATPEAGLVIAPRPRARIRGVDLVEAQVLVRKAAAPGATQAVHLPFVEWVQVDGWDNADAAKKEILKSVEAFEKK